MINVIFNYIFGLTFKVHYDKNINSFQIKVFANVIHILDYDFAWVI